MFGMQPEDQHKAFIHRGERFAIFALYTFIVRLENRFSAPKEACSLSLMDPFIFRSKRADTFIMRHNQFEQIMCVPLCRYTQKNILKCGDGALFQLHINALIDDAAADRTTLLLVLSFLQCLE